MNTTWKEATGRIVDEVRERRAMRAAQRHLREELATYDTAAEIYDLIASLNRLGADDRDPVRQILERNLRDRYRSSQLAS
jgi:hypothetical protein